MGKIHVLDTETSNKIAAGEVVERPSSVIKELAENSIDAGATVITVEIKNGGVTYMRVTDNGSGMSTDDAKICFLRHATSKISSGSDLDAIYTLGFRGEALSSIGAVSEVSLYTKRHEDETGICVTCKGGEILSSEDAGTPDGTTIVVENLFYNTPARLKFLKRDTTEAGYITDVMTRLVFAHPEISFKLIINGKEKIFSAGDNNLQNAVYTVYGKDYAKNTIPVEYDDGTVKISGLIGKGTAATAKRTHQSFFVNSRYIKSPIMIHALEEAYKNQIMIGKFPFAVLNVEIDPEMIDINVHPTKLEVKFSNERDIYNAVYHAVKDALYAIPNVPKIERREENNFTKDTPKEQLTLSDMAKDLPKSLRNEAYPKKAEETHTKGSYGKPYQEKQGFFGEAQKKEDSSDVAYILKNMTKRPDTPLFDPTKNPFIKEEKPKTEYGIELKDEYKDLLSGTFSSAKLKDSATEKADVQETYGEELEKEETTEETKEENNVFIDEYFEIVGQVFDTYILAEKGDEMMIIDQHAAHERLKFEELKREIDSKESSSQILIEPIVMDVTGSEIAAFEENSGTFSEMGFESEIFGESSIIIRAVPGGIEYGDAEVVMSELLSQAESMKKQLISDKRQALLYSVACKSAIKANRRLSDDEMKTLVRDVLRLRNINTCPHGRPIIITMSKKELEKEFKRIV